MSQCSFCRKLMLKKRFTTEFVLWMGPDFRTEYIQSCRACRASIESSRHVRFPSYPSPIKVISIYEPDGMGDYGNRVCIWPEEVKKLSPENLKTTVFHIRTPSPVPTGDKKIQYRERKDKVRGRIPEQPKKGKENSPPKDYYDPNDYHVKPLYVPARRCPTPQTILSLLRGDVNMY